MSEKFPSQLMDKFNLRLPNGMRDAVAKRAERNGRSMNSEIIAIIDTALNNNNHENINEIVDKLKKELISELTKEISKLIK